MKELKFDKQFFVDSCGEHLKKANEIFALVQSSQDLPEADILENYNHLMKHLTDAATLANLVSSVHPEGECREAAEQIEQEVSKLWTAVSLSRPIFDLFDCIDRTSLDADGARFVTKVLQDFHRSGVDKDDATRERIQSLSEELLLIGQEFGRNVRENVRFIEIAPQELAGMPQDYIAAHPAGENGLVKITTDYPDVVPFLECASSDDARKKIFIEFQNRAYPKNREVLQKLLEKRFELAGLLGYSSWADYVAEDKMTKKSETIAEFLQKLDQLTLPIAQKEYQELLSIKQQDFAQASHIEAWQKAYYLEKLQKQKFAFDSQELRPYFEYHAVKTGLFDLTSELFGIEYRAVSDADVWHEDVEVYDIFDQGKALGRIFLDMFPRENKYKHAAQFPIQIGIEGVQLPIGALVCNFTSPKEAENGIALLTHDEVVTFFHEFGHLLHYIFAGSHPWARTTELSMEWDFVEAPSQFFEHWARNYESLSRFAMHFETGETIPVELVEKMLAAERFGKGLFVRRQVALSMLSLSYYSHDPRTFDTHELMKKIQSEYMGMFPHVEGTNFELNFEHLDGYSAVYYTYMWSLVISKDLFSPFAQKGIMDKETALHYRKNILQPGGTLDARDMIKNFLGREYSFDPFIKFLEGKG